MTREDMKFLGRSVSIPGPYRNGPDGTIENLNAMLYEDETGKRHIVREWASYKGHDTKG